MSDPISNCVAFPVSNNAVLGHLEEEVERTCWRVSVRGTAFGLGLDDGPGLGSFDLRIERTRERRRWRRR